MQFHPEVLHTEHGQAILEHFLHDLAGIAPDWTTASIVDEQVAAIRAQVGDHQVICGLSGGVDSAVAAALVHEAVGDQLTCVFVDHGLLRKGEREQVERDYVAATGIRLVVVDVADRFLGELDGVTDPEEKRKTIGRLFIRVFEDAAAWWWPSGASMVARSTSSSRARSTRTSWSPVAAPARPTSRATTTSADCPMTWPFELVEPLRTLFKDEVRHVGEQLGLPAAMVWRHPFPGPGLAIRIIGAVNRNRLDILREADAIAREELTAAGLDRDVWQFPVVLLADVRSVGVQGDGRTYGHPVVLRPVSSEDAMTADWSRLPVRGARPDLHPDHQRGPRHQPGGARRHEQAPRHHRVGVARGATMGPGPIGRSNRVPAPGCQANGSVGQLSAPPQPWRPPRACCWRLEAVSEAATPPAPRAIRTVGAIHRPSICQPVAALMANSTPRAVKIEASGQGQVVGLMLPHGAPPGFRRRRRRRR